MSAKKVVLLLSFAAGVAACSKSPPPPPKTAEPPATTAQPKKDKVPDMDAEIGALDEKQVTKTFERLMGAIDRCQDDRRKADKLDFLSGEVALEVKVAKDGRAVEAKLTTTTLGDRATEKCILGAVRGADWPKPQGGRHGIAKSSFQLPMKGDRDAVAWEPTKVSSELSRTKGALAACTKGQKGRVTVYVDTNGKVLAAGASGFDDAASDCVTNEAAKMKFSSPGGWPAKVTFSVD